MVGTSPAERAVFSEASGEEVQVEGPAPCVVHACPEAARLGAALKELVWLRRALQLVQCFTFCLLFLF